MTDTPTATATLVVAYGNPLRGDDGVAWHVADALRASHTRGPAPDGPAPDGLGPDDLAPDDLGRLRVITTHQLTPELADAVAVAWAVVFVDAACDRAPGEVDVRPLNPAVGPAAGFTQHQFDPSMLLRLAREVHGRAPAEAWLVTVGAGHFDCGEILSPAVAAAVPRACAAVLEALGSGRRLAV